MMSFDTFHPMIEGMFVNGRQFYTMCCHGISFFLEHDIFVLSLNTVNFSLIIKTRLIRIDMGETTLIEKKIDIHLNVKGP